MIPQPLPLLFPVVAATLAAWIKDSRLPQWGNYAIVAAAFVLAVVLSIAFGGGLTGNPGRDIGIIIAECAAVFAALKPLMDQASSLLPSPFSKYAAKRLARLRVAKRNAEAWKATTNPVPPRASAQPLPGRPWMSPGVVDGSGRSLPSQPGLSGSWSHPLPGTKQFVEDATPTAVDVPAAVPKRPPTNPLY
jgi:hypothetical protein